MQNDSQTRPRETRLASPAERKTIVIADDGYKASVVLLDAAQSTDAGSHFSHSGRQWVIRGQRHHSRVLVAEPFAGVQH